MTNIEKLNIGPRLQIATKLAPAFTHKFDYSEDKNFASLAEMAFKAADALVKLADEKQAAAQKKDDDEAAATAKALAEKKLREGA